METLEDLIAEFEEKYKQDTSGEKVSGYLLAPGGLEKPWDNHVKIALPSDIVSFIRHVYASALEWGASKLPPGMRAGWAETDAEVRSIEVIEACRSILLSESKRIKGE